MRYAERSKLGLILLALALPLGGLVPAQADFTPNPNQQITIRLPVAGMTLPVDGDMPFVYETDDGQEAVGYLDGWQRLENGVSMPLGNFGVGTHSVQVHPVLYPESAQEVSFQVTPGITILEDDENVLVHLRIEPQSLSRLVPESLKIVEVNGLVLQPEQYVAATLPLTTGSVEYHFPLSEAVAKFSKAALIALTNGQPAKRILLAGTLAASGDIPQQDFLLHDNVDPDIPCEGVKNKFIFERTWGDPNAPSDALSSPGGLAVDRIGGFVYVINGGTRQIVKYDTSGTELLRWGGSGSGPGQFSTAVAVAVSADGQVIYVTDNGLNRVQKFSPAGTFLLQWGTSGSGDGQFFRASGVAVAPDGSVYVGDQGSGRIQKFDANGVFQLKWGSLGFGPGQFSYPGLFGIGVAPDASVYATDIGTGRVQRFTASGAFVLQWSALASPFNVAFSPDGGTLYVTENSAGRVRAFDPTGTPLFTIGSYGSADGQFRAPYGVGTDGTGNVYVADSLNNRVTKLTATGTFIAKWGELNTVPVGVGARCALDNQGHIYFTLQTTIQKYDMDGGFIKAWGGPGSSDGKFGAAADVAVSPDGQFVYVSDSAYPYPNRIQKFTADGAFVMSWATGIPGAPAIDVDSQGNLYAAQYSPPLVKKFSPTGTLLLQWGSTGTGDGQFEYALQDIAIDRGADTIYILEYGFTHSVQTFDSQGNFLSNWGLIPGPGRYLRAIGVDQGPLQGVYLTRFGGWSKWKKDRTFVAQYLKYGSGDDAFQYGEPRGIVVDTSENIYATDVYYSSIPGKVKKFKQGCLLPPTASAGPDQAAGAYLVVALDGSASHDNGGGSLVSSVWSFSDGSPNQTGLVTTHRFYQPGVYTATLTVTDDDGMTALDSATINVVSGPTAVIEASSLNVPAGTTVNFSGTGSSDPVAAITGYRWTFGDGGSATGAQVSHAFAFSGTYPVTLTVEDALGLTGTAQVQIQVTSIVPQLFSDLEALIRTIPHQGMVNSLLAKLNAARASFEAGQINTALNQLNALLNEVQAQTGKKIDAALAAQITAAAAALQQQAQAGEQAGVAAQVASPLKQAGITGRLLSETLKIQIRQNENPLADEPVLFRVTEGGGVLVRDWVLDATTNAEGLAGMRFLCPNKAGFSKVQALRRDLDPQTGILKEYLLAEFSIETRAPEMRPVSGSQATTVFQENASQSRYSIFLPDPLVGPNAPLADQDIEFRIVDSAGVPYPEESRGILVPRTQLTGSDGMAHTAYVSQESTPPGTVYIQARPLPPVKDEAGNPVAVLFGAITVAPEQVTDYIYNKHDILRGNGQVVLPGTETGEEILVRFVPPPSWPDPGPPFIFFQTLVQNGIRTTTGTEWYRDARFGSLTVEVRGNVCGIKVTTASTREPQFVSGHGSTPFHGRSDMAVGQPDVRLVVQEGPTTFLPADHVLPANLENLSQAKQYFVEARLPKDAPAPKFGVQALDAGRAGDLQMQEGFVAEPLLENLPFQQIEMNDRYILWRTSAPIIPVLDTVLPGQTPPSVPPGALQIVAFGAIRPFVEVGGLKLLGNAPEAGAIQLEEERFTTPFASGRILSKFVHLGVVTPIVDMDAGASTVQDDSVTVRGTVKSTPHALEVSPGLKPVVHVEGVEATVTAMGDGLFIFEATVQLDEAEQTIRTSAYNPYGGFGQDRFIVHDDDSITKPTTTPQDRVEDSCQPVLQRIIMGRNPALLALSPLTVRLKQQNGNVRASITLPLEQAPDAYGRVVWSQPFVVTDADVIKVEADMLPLSSRVLVTSDLNDDLEVLALGGAVQARFQLAGVRITSPAPFSVKTVSIPLAQDPGHTELNQEIHLQLRNVQAGRRPRVKVRFFGDGLNVTKEANVNMAGDLLNSFANDYPTEQVGFLPGRSKILATVVDKEGRQVVTCSETAFDFRDALLTHIQEIVPGVLVFPLKSGTTDAQVSTELKRLQLRMVGRVRFADGGSESQVDDSLFVEPADGNVTRAIGAIRTSALISPLDAQEEIVNDPPGPNFLTFWTASGRRWQDKVKDRNRDVRDALVRATSAGAPSETFYVADMRIGDPQVELGTTPTETNPRIDPIYEFGAPGAPTYQLKNFRATGVDQRRKGKRFETPGDGANSDRPPRIRYEPGPAITLTDAILTPQVKGVILQIHGFNENFLDKPNEFGQVVVERPSLLSNTMPFSQHLMRRKDGVPVPSVRLEPERYVIIHVAWTGDFSGNTGALPDAFWFNTDYALADHTGRNPLVRLIRDIQALRGSDPEFSVTLIPQSLGNRLAAGNADALRKDAIKKVGSIPFPSIKLVLAHPALRQPDLLDNKEQPVPSLPATPLMLEFSKVKPSIMFFSHEDKTGVPFKAGQKVPMLGREGLPSDNQNPSKDYASVLAKLQQQGKDAFDVKAYEANSLPPTDAFKDRWHVQLFGAVIPDMLEFSRPTHTLNGEGPLGSGVIGVARTKYHLIRFQGQHLNPVWDAIAGFVKQDIRPATVP